MRKRSDWKWEYVPKKDIIKLNRASINNYATKWRGCEVGKLSQEDSKEATKQSNVDAKERKTVTFIFASVIVRR